ncbi:PH domain-containing protein [Lacticaseibacillus pabuli]|uniref:PH domain-containing protein n=1 Tax=Lacticaseibacillus pabuli TaxID=3025672 RepID=A0ABY7WV02_9LACO|nr:PH domain-containing protein [Lacticaseibacillus sp. KACC 23028]WDF82884.1 PH domain-containing protein [Lacticaseibacillus sp. KACC 23028]
MSSSVKPKWHLMNPLAIVTRSLAVVYLPVAKLFFNNDGKTSFGVNVLWALAIWAFLIVVAILPQYLTTRYRLDDDALVFRSGVFRRHVTEINYGRIQTVQHKQWFYMRPFNIEALTIETAAHQGKAPEVSLDAVAKRVGQEIEQRQANWRDQAAQPAKSETPDIPATDATAAPANTDTWQYSLSESDLLNFALTSLGFVPLAGSLLLAFNYLQHLPFIGDWVARLSTKMQHLQFGLQAVGFVLGTAFVLAIFAAIVDFARMMNKYWHFHLDYDGHHMHVQQGLLATNNLAAETSRIQALTFKQNVLRQLRHMGSGNVVLASGNNDDDTSGTLTVLPYVDEKSAWDTFAQLVDWLPSKSLRMTPITTARFAMIRNSILASLIVVVPALIWLRPFSYISLAMLPISFGYGWFAANARGIGFDERHMLVSVGKSLNRTEYLFTKNRVQSLEIKQSWFMQRTQLVHIIWHIRQGNGDESVELRYVPATLGKQVYEWYQGHPLPKN